MSSFVVSPKTINRIVNYLCANHTPIDKNGFDGERITKTLLNLNLKATGARYGTDRKKTSKEFEVNIGEYRFVSDATSLNLIQTYKSLNCFLYQCSEGNVPNTKLYKRLREIEANLARDIIGDLPEYKEAEWG